MLNTLFNNLYIAIHRVNWLIVLIEALVIESDLANTTAKPEMGSAYQTANLVRRFIIIATCLNTPLTLVSTPVAILTHFANCSIT